MPLGHFAIDALQIKPGLVLAPMSGVTDSPFRRLVRMASGDAVGLLVSEFISVELLTHRTMQAMVRMAFHPSERPVSIQIYGSEAHKMAEAARIIEDAGADVVDINCGCPAPKIVRRGGGAGLLRDLPRLGEIIEAVATAVSLPVTVKIRNGWCEDSLNAMETLRIAEESGARAIAVHGRTRMQLYTGSADWEVVRRMVEVARIPVLGSGDVLTAADALHRFETTGCAGVMIGRGAVTNPWIFRQIVDEASGRVPTEPSWRERIAALEAYLGMLGDTYPARVLPGRLKMMLSRLIKGIPEAPEIRLRCLRASDPHAMLAMLGAHCAAHGVLDHAPPTDGSLAAA
ncbi:MAG: tRNA dihydrouridine synthase DusB [Deltaproteobacteria bacterium]|nr:tRNA dihydrouridine synthase DusB [Deltaproteobacteria bacterium]MCB9785761.1 tRNA dihydrouridine synthase DusB [Deltaproteobacteria bacterium]